MNEKPKADYSWLYGLASADLAPPCPSERMKVRTDVGTAHTAHFADEARLQIGQPHVIRLAERPVEGREVDRDEFERLMGVATG